MGKRLVPDRLRTRTGEEPHHAASRAGLRRRRQRALSELTILKEAFDQGRTGAAVLFLALLALVFVGMMTVMLRMSQGKPQGESAAPLSPEPLWSTAPPAVLAVLVLALGLYLPGPLSEVLHPAARILGGA
jgi:formate hydrogenlyase subunit 3/multisubunit Na+/H+ antiporter MnhD subunit